MLKKLLFYNLLAILPVTGFAQKGPAGIGDSATNKLWLHGGSGTYSDSGITGLTNNRPVFRWSDVSGNNNHAYQPVTANMPIYSISNANGLPALRFTGDLFIDAPGPGISSSGSYTYIIVFTDTASSGGGINDGSGDYILDRTPATNNLVSLKALSGNVYAYQKRNDAGGGLGGPSSTTAINTSTKFIQFMRTYNTHYKLMYNGLLQDSIADSDGATTPPTPRIGRHYNNPNGGIRGYIHEVIIYSRTLNEAEKIILSNYLSAKYNISLSGNDLYTMDNTGNGNFDFDVAGIGRINASNLVNDAKGPGMLRISNPSGLGNNEFLIWGHNNGSMTTTNTSDIPFGMYARLNRVWRFSEVNMAGSAVDVGSVDLQWDLSALGPVSASNLRLLIDTDNDGLFSDETPISGATLVSGSTYQFASVSGTTLTNQSRLTIGTSTSLTPLPVALLSFNEKCTDNHTDITWVVSEDINTGYFTLERSHDGLKWQELAKIKSGTGASHDYIYTDKNPINGQSFYRLKHTGKNGITDYFSQILQGCYDAEKAISIFPNISNGKFTIQGADGASGMTVYSSEGIAMLSYTSMEDGIEIDLGAFADGVYFVCIVMQDKTIIKKLLKYN
jgi:hypothetical protein